MASEPKEVTAALAVLDDAVNRCMKEDNVCTAEVLVALDLLAAKATAKRKPLRKTIRVRTLDS